MKEASAQFIYLKDYTPPNYIITKVDLTLDLADSDTKVVNISSVKKNPKYCGSSKDLFLNGEKMTLSKVSIDNKEIPANQYVLSEEGLLIKNVPDQFNLTIENTIDPLSNKTLEGLYKSGNIFCTQCEAEGFRRITFFIDRPDNMAVYSTKIIADKKYPVLLSNGNLIDEGELPSGKHFAKWHDPFPKPSYLYALVAGDLGVIKDNFKSMSAKNIDLRIYCDKGNEDKCKFAMESVKAAMKWDEDTFGLEYDLNIYMIVAVDAFNFGAMENKGLNIFNSVYVLADEESATDDNFHGIEGVVGHEYFHNWTGNRITCRDWFQLTLKEGLTVFRDQEFSADMNSRVVGRIGDVERLREAQFAEDGGPNAHPIRPPYYATIDNFYTPTIYEKGAEVIRMIETILGKKGFRAGMDKYFELFDGQGVTTDDFVHAMSVANNYDFTQFKTWYKSATTPEVSVTSEYLAAQKTLSLTIKQTRKVNRYETASEIEMSPLHFPLALGILDKNSKEIPLKLKSADLSQTAINRGVLHIRKNQETFQFEVNGPDFVLSLNRGFKAPIKIKYAYSVEQLGILMAHDTDGFNRYEASTLLSTRLIKGLISDYQNKHEFKLHPTFILAFKNILKDKVIDPAFKAKCLSLPSEDMLAQELNPIDFEAIHEARNFVKKRVLEECQKELMEIYNHCKKTLQDNPEKQIARGLRTLKNTVLNFISCDSNSVDLIWEQYQNSNNMTEKLAALILLCNNGGEKGEKAITDFRIRFEKNPLVIQKWLAAQAQVHGTSTLSRVIELEKLPLYDKTIPNFVRALISRFAGNGYNLHHPQNNFAAHAYLAQKIIEIDAYNPQLASRLVSPFNDYARLKKDARESLKKQMMKIIEHPKISKNVLEICSKILDL